MRKILATIFVSFLLLVNWTDAQTVRIETDEAKQRADVTVDGKLFTSYRWDERFKRPILQPILTAGGAFVTRGFPFETRDGETVDHPHQIGCSFSYGDVNGVDFWNTSIFRTPQELQKMGRIVHQKILKIKNGKNSAELVTQSIWVMPNGKTVLFDTTKYTFRAKDKTRVIDRETTLAAKDEPVIFGDNKEGLFALRLSRELEQADQVGVKTTSADGAVSESKSNENLSGEFTTSEKITGNKIWGTSGRWVSVAGAIGGEAVTAALFDSPKNKNFPSLMMVRGYGLLALNPFGRKAFQPNETARKFVLEPKQSIEFRHRLLILAEKAGYETIEKEFQKFIK